MARPRTRTKREDRDRRPKKKVSILDQESVEWIDYKDVNLLRRFMSERAKIRARRVTGNDAQQQRAVARAIRIAREMALLPYSVRQVTHRSKGKRGDRDGGVLRDFPRDPRPDTTEGVDLGGESAEGMPSTDVMTDDDVLLESAPEAPPVDDATDDAPVAVEEGADAEETS
ncbi:MAG: 30S ribosomal protein S18 [Actinobacteria bacterium]|nr:30S ribosomal protein S18 [Actinomycetota bacterium]